MIHFTLNGRQAECRPEPCERLSESLRERLDCRDVKVGCDAGDCGACTVLLDGDPVCSCLTPSHQVAGRRVETLSGLIGQDPNADALAVAFQRHGAAQCGICTPGMIVTAVALLRDNNSPAETELADALGGVLCRCTGYRKIIDAVRDVGNSVTASECNLGGGIGIPIQRVDGEAKVEGREVFGDDVGDPGWLSVLVIRSPYPRASFRIGNIENFIRENEGIEAVLTADDVPGLNRMGVIPGFIDQPVFAEREARFRGEAVAALVGRREALQGFDVQDFPVEWEELPHIAETGEALNPESVWLHSDRPGNVMCRGKVRRGDVGRALAAAAVVVEGEFTTSFVEHAYIEPEAGCGLERDGRIEVHAGTQAPVMDRDSLAAILAVDKSMVRVGPDCSGRRLRSQAGSVGAAISGTGGSKNRSPRPHGVHQDGVDAIDDPSVTPPAFS